MRILVVACLLLCSVTASAGTVSELNEAFEAAYQKKDWDEAAKWLALLIEAEPDASKHLYNMACVRSLQGETDRALDSLQRLLAMGYTKKGELERDTNLSNIHQAPRYKQMIGELGSLLDPLRLPAGEQQLTVDVPMLMECYAVMLYIGNPDHPVLTRQKNHPYIRKIDAYFGAYKEHDLVQRLARMYPGKSWKNNLRAHHNLRALYIYDDLDISQIVRYPLEIRTELATMVKRFAEDSDFEGFYRGNEPLYDSMKQIVVSKYAFGANVISFFNENFQQPFNRFNVYFTPLWGGWQHGPSIIEDDYRECFYFGGCLYSTTREFFYPDQKLQFLLLTEFDHAMINPITRAFRGELSQLDDKLPLLNSDEESNYGTLSSTLNEYLTWAFALQFFYEHAPDQYPHLKESVTRIMDRRGFTRFEKFMQLYHGYMDDRSSYPLLEDYYPVLIDWVGNLK